MFNFVLYILEPPVILDLESELLEASKSGDLDKVQKLLTTYPNIVNCRDLDGRYLLIFLHNIYLT